MTSVNTELLYEAPDEGRTVYNHAVFSVGVGLNRDGTPTGTVLVHATVGESKFEYRITPENARIIGVGFIDAAERVLAQAMSD